MDLPFFTATPRRWHKRKQPTGVESTPLTLVSATYDPVTLAMTLTFDAEINTDAMDMALFEVIDAESNNQTLHGFTTIGLTANSVTIELEAIGPATGSGVTLNVEPGNGIVAVADGAEWGGVTGLALPFE